MGFYIFAPAPATTSVDVPQKVLGTPTTPTPAALTANTASTIIPTDATAPLLGRVIHAITNTSTTATAFVALGRTASLTNYDYPLYPGTTLADKEIGSELVSVISAGTPTIVATFAKYVEVV